MKASILQKTFYIIDGYAQVFRAYYAIRTAMFSPDTGEPTNATFGFTGMLLKMLSKFQPDYVAVAIDAPGKTFRDELYQQYLRLHPANVGFALPVREVENIGGPVDPLGGGDEAKLPQPEGTETGRYVEYKGTRNATPNDLTYQIDRIFQVIQAFGFPIIGQSGIEADDVIATLVQQILDDPDKQDVHIRIVSKDKDLEQLLCDRVSIFDVHTDIVRDVAGLHADKGITPSQVVDVMALTGDTVDNVPGVEGIGLKTAAQLVQQWGSMEGVLANLEQIKGKRRENLEKAREYLPISKAMVTLKRDADLPFMLEKARVQSFDLPRLIALFQLLGFNRYQEEARRLSTINSPPVASAQDTDE